MDKTLNLRLFRKRNGLTQNAVAEYLGVSKVFISYVESGRSALPEDKFQQIINNDRGWVVEDSFLVATTLTAPTKKVPDFYESDLFRVRLIPFEARGGMIGDFVDGVMDYDCEMVVSPIEPDCTSNWARHTWATLAADLDFTEEALSWGMGHKTGHRVTEIYIHRSDAKCDEANRAVIDYLWGKQSVPHLTTQDGQP